VTDSTHDTKNRSDWETYEREKKHIQSLNFSEEQYKNEINKLIERLQL
jgi:hypothetical protein